MLWLLFAALSFLVFGILAYPLARRSGERPSAHIDFDIAVYRDQLEELNEEIDRGILNDDDGAAARTEIRRRMLAAEDVELKGRATETSGRNNRRAALAGLAIMAVLLPAGVFAMYAAIGSPQLASESRGSAFVAATSAEELAKQLQGTPTPEGYKRLANMYFAAAQYDKAVAADHRAIELGADDSTTWSEFGEAIVMASGGQVAPQALAAFTNAISLDPHDARAQFYIGMAEAQIGDLRQAVAIWRNLEENGDPNAKWRPMVRQHVLAFAKQGGFDPSSIAPAAPSPSAMRSAVAAMTGALQQEGVANPAVQSPSPVSTPGADAEDAMIRAMVDRLATRMNGSPNDADGWRRLAHAYNVLGETEKAQEAIAHAVRLKPNDVDVQLTVAETEKAMRDSRNR